MNISRVASVLVLSLTAATLVSGCSWLRGKTSAHRTDYLRSEQKAELVVPEGVDAPQSLDTMKIPPHTKPGTAISDKPPAAVAVSVGFIVKNQLDDVWSEVRSELRDYDGLTLRGESKALSGFDVEVQGQSFIIQVKEAGEERIQVLAVDGTGRVLNTGPAATVMQYLAKRVN